MRYKITYSLRARLVDHDGSDVTATSILGKTNGIACHNDSILNYAELDFSESCDLRGGFPRLLSDDQGKLVMVVEVDATRKLTRSELADLRSDFEGQLSDGIGKGGFDELSNATGLAATVRFPIQPRCTQQPGRAWKPTTTTPIGNQRRIAAIKKLVDAMDSAPAQKPAKRKPSASKATKSHSKPNKAESVAPKSRPNLKKLFRLLAKVDRAQRFDEIKAELEASGNDLSGVVDGELPYGNYRDPKLLRLLLKAGLSPEVCDEKGHTLLYLSAVSPQCVEILLKLGVDVNRACSNSDGSTALMRAASLCAATSVQLLLEAGANPSIKARDGKTALQQVDRRDRRAKQVETMLHDAT